MSDEKAPETGSKSTLATIADAVKAGSPWSWIAILVIGGALAVALAIFVSRAGISL